MTIRAFILGLIGAVLICTLTYLNDYVLLGTYLVGNSLPVSIFGTLIVFLFFNAFLFRTRERLALNGKELTLILTMTLSACVVPSSGLLRTFTDVLVVPHQQKKTYPGWAKEHIIDEIAPPEMLVDVTKTVHSGELVAVEDQQVTLDEKASSEPDAYKQLMIELMVGDRRQVRRIKEYDAETKVAKLESKWELKPEPGTEYTIEANNEDEVITPFIQGQPQRRVADPILSLTGKAKDFTENTITLEEERSSVDGTYVGMTIAVDLDGGKKSKGRIAEYDGKNRVATIEGEWSKETVPGAKYRITQPRVPSRFLFWKPQVVTGLIQGIDGREIKVPETLSNAPDAFADMTIEITSGDGAGQKALIVDYNGGSRTLTVNKDWETPPKVGDEFRIVCERDPAMTGKVVAADKNSITLESASSHKDQEYNAMTVKILTGPGSGQSRKISGYDGLKQVAAVEKKWKEVPTSESTYEIVPKPLIPWHAWSRTLWFWIPLILALWLGLVGLSFVFHKQWSDHEHLPYPIANFANSLLPENESGVNTIIRDRKFLIAGGIVLFIYMFNYLNMWFPDTLQAIPLRFDIHKLLSFGPLKGRLHQVGTIWILFTVIAIAYFLPSDVSFSLGISKYVWQFTLGVLAIYGVSVRDGGGTGHTSYERYLAFGSYLGMMIIILYTGRYYYLNVMKKALFLPSEEELPGYTIWGARAFVVTMVIFVAVLQGIGLDWQLGILYAIGVIIMFVVMGRIIAETGLFFIQTWFLPGAILVGLMGTKSLGPSSIFILYMLCVQLTIDPREALMPFMVNNLKMLDIRKHKMSVAGMACVIALLVGLAVGLPWTIYNQYSRGMNASDSWASIYVPRTAPMETLQMKQRMAAQGTLEDAYKVDGFERFLKIKPLDPGLIWAMLIGAALVISMSFMRLRFNKWPIHPVLFLVWIAWAPGNFCTAFLVGWVLKAIVMRFGGPKVYQSWKPVVIGALAGELLGAMLPILIGFIYYMVTGDLPRKFKIFPG